MRLRLIAIESAWNTLAPPVQQVSNSQIPLPSRSLQGLRNVHEIEFRERLLSICKCQTGRR